MRVGDCEVLVSSANLNEESVHTWIDGSFLRFDGPEIRDFWMADKVAKNEPSRRKTMEEKGLELMAQLNVSFPPSRSPHRPNVFRVHMDAPLPVHQYHVEGRLFFAKRSVEQPACLEFTSQCRNDTRAHERPALARQIFVALQVLHPDTMPREGRSVYDGASQLFTLDVLKDGEKTIDITVTAEEWTDLRRLRTGASRVHLSLQRTDRVTELGHVARALPADINDNQRLALLVQFLELASADKAADAGKHVLFRNGLCVLKEALDAGFTLADLAELPGGGSVARGCRKSARAMGDGAEVEFGLVIDPKIAPMHDVELLSSKVLRQFPRLQNGPHASAEEVARFLRGLFFLPVHRTASRPMRVADISDTTAATQYFEQEGHRISVQRYFKEQYGRDLQHPQLPLVVQSAALSEAHMRVEAAPVQVQAHVLDAPALRFQRSEQRLGLLKGSWRMDAYFRPADVSKWAMYSLTRAGGLGGNNMSETEARQFGTAFYTECRRKGMRMAPVTDFRVVEVPPHDFGESECVKNLLATVQHKGCQFVLVITGPQDNTIHDALKYQERNHDVNVLSTTAKAAAGIGERLKRVTMENIVNKTNVKNGGLNFEISADAAKKALGTRDLFIGVSSNLAGGGFRGEPRAPTVIGYAATDKQHPADYTGNYVFLEAQRDEKLQMIAGIVSVALARFRKHRGHAPDRVFVFRNSPAEGSYEHLMRFEIPLVKKVLRESGADAKLMFIVATRLHPIRLMPAASTGGKALEQNLRPGTCVDTGITGPFVPEFFLLGHAGKLGTSRVPRYSVLCNEAAMSMEDVQRTTFHLCFGHQIVAGMTSLPAPMFIGDEMAKRGRSIYNTAVSEHEVDASTTDFNALSERLDYAAGSRLRDLRFNA
ncbi:hypothetical protein M3Y99_01254400 [Aphelenchoides fujianensis]|nr:hypothetical protein M3Y99_01254400 [Aphelenchoides fujianensis]